MRKRILVIGGAVASIAALLGLFGVAAFPVHADDETGNPATSIQLSPVSQRVDLKANDVVDSKIKITNIGTESLSFRVYATPYGVTDVTYEANFDIKTDYTLIANWITFDQAEYKDVAVGGVVEVPYHINTPSEISGGGQYAVVFAETLPGATDATASASIQTVGRVGSLLYADLGGETRKEGDLVSFEQPTFAEVSLKPVVRVKNSGNIDFSYSHAVTVKTLFGKEVYNNTVSRVVLPETTRESSQEWTEAPSAGIYSVTNKISFLNKTAVDETKLVYIGPLWILITILVILGLILILIVLIIVKKVRNNTKNKGSKKEKISKKSNDEPVKDTDEIKL